MFDGANFDERLEMLIASVAAEPRFSVAASRGGLFLEIAREARDAYGPATRLRFLCGRDAAERIVNWPYAGVPSISEQLGEYELLVAPRAGMYVPPAHLSHAVAALPVGPEYDDLSATDIRRRIAGGEPWEHLVDEPVVELARRAYAGRMPG
jgi:nicotinic acid mononucleotide adenylyltransferase